MNDWLTLSMMSNWILWWTLWAQLSSHHLPWPSVPNFPEQGGGWASCLTLQGELVTVQVSWVKNVEEVDWNVLDCAGHHEDPGHWHWAPLCPPHHCWGSPCPTQWGSPPLTLWLSLSRDSAELDIWACSPSPDYGTMTNVTIHSQARTFLSSQFHLKSALK